MNQRSLFLFLALTLMGNALRAQLQRIVLQGTGAPQVFTSVNAAIAAAQPDDRLYFSGGTFSDTNIVVTIPLHFIGAGISPDTSAVTSTTTIATPGDYMAITTSASGSTFTGIRFSTDSYFYYGLNETNDDPTGLVFERCVFDSRVYTGNGSTIGASSSVFNECVLHGALYGQTGITATLNRCILDLQLGTGAEVSGFQGGGLTLRHCICLGTRIGNSSNCTIENSIFTRTNAPFWQSNGAVLTNNLCVSDALVSNMSPGASVGNVLTVPIAEIFVSEDNNNFDWTDDLHLQPASAGVGMATDGTDVGLYGTSTPWKEGSAPFNPHFRAAAISPSTNPNGDLPVNIRVAAQTH